MRVRILRIKQRERASEVNVSSITPTLSGELRCRLFTRVGIARGDVDLGTILYKASGDHEANAPSTTGNEDYLALKLVRIIVPPELITCSLTLTAKSSETSMFLQIVR